MIVIMLYGSHLFAHYTAAVHSINIIAKGQNVGDCICNEFEISS